MWTNLTNDKRYIGSAIDLPNRLSFYYSFPAIENLLKRSKSHICSALLKYGHSNFSLTILEYCEVSDLLIREKHYWGIFNPDYNIAKEPGAPFSGRKHSDETKQIISDAKKINNPGRFKIGENNPNYGKKVEGAGRPSQQIEVTDITNNITTSYDSISSAARTLNINFKIISKYILRNQQKPYKGQYTFKKL